MLVNERKFDELSLNLDEITASFKQDTYILYVLTHTELEDVNFKSKSFVGNGCDILFEK